MNNYKRTVDACPKMLSENEIESIHNKSMMLLQTTGIEVQHDQGLKLLEKAGAKVDFQTRMVKIPPELVENSLETLPDKFLLAARDPEKDCFLETGARPYSRNGGGPDFTLDLETDEIRTMNKADMIDYYRLIDALDNIEIVAPLYGQDLPVRGREILVFREMLVNSSKHLHIRAFTRENMEFILKMAELMAGGRKELGERPIAQLLEAPVSPLKFIDIAVDGLLLAGEYGVPIELCTMPICGGTGPITLAGNLVLINAEFLGGVVISQAANPGAKIEYAARPMIMDMSSGLGLTGSMEAAMMSAGAAQLAASYKVPVSLHGPWSDSMTYDGQSTFERTNFASMSAFAGANVLSGSGMIQQGIGSSHIQMVIDDEINGALYFALGGFPVDEDHFGIDAIERVGPGGNYLADPHTMEFLRGERHEPNILYRNARPEWEEEGSKSFEERARERAKKLIAEHEPMPIPSDKLKALDELVADALRILNNK